MKSVNRLNRGAWDWPACANPTTKHNYRARGARVNVIPVSRRASDAKTSESTGRRPVHHLR
jgi:hypothetical protein